jgi:hypothetical protein
MITRSTFAMMRSATIFGSSTMTPDPDVLVKEIRQAFRRTHRCIMNYTDCGGDAG